MSLLWSCDSVQRESLYLSVLGFLCVSVVSSSSLRLSSSRPHRLTNSMKEVIIGRSRALPGGTTCIWIQALALSQDLSCILNLLLFLLLSTLFFSIKFLPLSYISWVIKLIALSALLTRYSKAWSHVELLYLLRVCTPFLCSLSSSIQDSTTRAPHC